jgi:Ca2+-binding RTX toxin-like protein
MERTMPDFIGDVDDVGDTDPNFPVTLTAGHTYYLDLEGLPSATTPALYDPFLWLRNSAGARIVFDDDGGVDFNSRIVFTPTVTDTYIAEPAGFGNATGHYQLHINEDDFRGTIEGNGTAGALGNGGFGAGTINFTSSTNNDGTANLGDRDVFAVDLVAGRTYHFEQLGSATGDGTLFDSYLRLLSGSGAGAGTIVAQDDDGGVGLNSRIVYTPTESGTYYLQAGGYSDFNSGTYRVFAHEDEYRDTVEGNGAQGAINTGASGTASLQVAGDHDVWATTLISGLTYTIQERGTGSGAGTLVDPVLSVQDANGAVLASDDDSGAGDDSLLTYQATTTGTHILDAGSYINFFAGTYALSVSAGVGTAAADAITGTGQADAINGVGGADRIFGGSGADTLRGGAGADTLGGGGGADILIGGSGNDRFDFNAAGESTPAARDILRAGDGGRAFDGAGGAAGDRIDLAGVDANTGSGGNNAFVFGGHGAGHIFLTESGSNTILNGNVDGDPAIEFQVVIEDAGVRASQYGAADFVL